MGTNYVYYATINGYKIYFCRDTGIIRFKKNNVVVDVSKKTFSILDVDTEIPAKTISEIKLILKCGKELISKRWEEN